MTDIELRFGTEGLPDATRGISGLRDAYQRLAKELQRPLRQIDTFRALEEDLESGARAMALARNRVRDLGNELARTAAPAAVLKQGYRDSVNELQRLERAEARQKVTLAGLRAELQAAGVDTSRLAAERSRLSTALSENLTAGRADAGINASLGTLNVARLRELEAQLKSLPADYARLSKSGVLSAREQAAAQAQLQKQLAQTKQEIKELSGPVGGGTIGLLGRLGLASLATYSVTEGVGAYMRSVDGVRKLNVQLKLATTSQDEFNTAQRVLAQLAEDNQAPLGSLYQLYGRIAPALRDAKKGQAEVLGVTEAVTAAMRVSGATAAESEGAIVQFAQALGAGALRGDEFNSVAEQSPRLMRALADGLGVARSQLKAMADAGQLTTDVVVTGLLKELPKLRAEAALLPKTWEGSMTEVKNEAVQAASAFDNLTNFSSRLTEQLRGVTGPLRTVSAYLNALNKKGSAGAGELFSARGLAEQAKFAQDRINQINLALKELQETGEVSVGLKFSLGTGDRGELEAQLKDLQAKLDAVKKLQDGAAREQEESTKKLEQTYRERDLALADSFANQLQASQEAANASDSSNKKAVAARKAYTLQMDVLDRAESDAAARRLAREEKAAQEAAGIKVDELALLKTYVEQSGSTWDAYLARQTERQRLELVAIQSAEAKKKAAREKATADLKTEMGKQLDALKEAQANYEKVVGETQGNLKPFKDLVKSFKDGTAGQSADPTYGQVQDLKLKARTSIDKDPQKALEYANKAREALEQLMAAGQNAYGLNGVAQELEDIATAATEVQKVRAADNVNRIEQSLVDLQKRMDLVKIAPLEITLDENSVAQLAKRLQEVAAAIAKTLTIQAKVTTDGVTTTPVNPDFNPQASKDEFSGGGFTGPGGKYEEAGTVHRGEHVQPQEVVREPGALGFLERVRLHGFQNTMQALRAKYSGGWRGYASGGLVTPVRTPSIPAPAGGLVEQSSAPSLTPVNVYLEGRRYSMMAGDDTLAQLHRAALKKGHRRND